MPAASRVVLVPPEAWDEARLVDAARALPRRARSLAPGDAVGDLVVVRVEPENGSIPDASTVYEIAPSPRPRAGHAQVALVIDASQSMATPWDKTRTRLQAAREAVVKHLRGADYASATVIAYARDPRVVAGPSSPRALAKSDILIPAPAGASRAATAISAAVAHLAAQSHDGPQAIAWLTDGADERLALMTAAARANRLGIPIHVVVFAPEHDAVFEEVARATGGSVQIAGLPPAFDIPRSPPA